MTDGARLDPFRRDFGSSHVEIAVRFRINTLVRASGLRSMPPVTHVGSVITRHSVNGTVQLPVGRLHTNSICCAPDSARAKPARTVCYHWNTLSQLRANAVHWRMRKTQHFDSRHIRLALCRQLVPIVYCLLSIVVGGPRRIFEESVETAFSLQNVHSHAFILAHEYRPVTSQRSTLTHVGYSSASSFR